MSEFDSMFSIDELNLSALQRLLDDVGNFDTRELDTMLEWATQKHRGYIPRKYFDD